MEFIINEEHIPMINNGKLNISKIYLLISLKEFIDNISSNSYMSDDVVLNIKKRYNEIPTVITWGDYFQTELVFEMLDSSDEDFQRAVNIIKFDIISSYIIFSGKLISFMDWVEDNFQYIQSRKDQFSSEEYEEAFHLKILKDYYINLGIVNNFSSEEMDWYNIYKEDIAV